MMLRNLIKGTALMAATSLPFLCASKRRHDVYMWGNGIYQARPDALLQFRNFTPKRITNLPDNLISLEFGQYYEAGIDEKGGLWIWRTQITDSNLDPANKQYDHERKQVQQLAKNIKEVKFTTGYIWTLDTNNKVHQYPIIKDIKEGTVQSVKLGKSREVDPLRGSTQIAAGVDHMIALKGGEVWSMGDDTYGQCGVESSQRQTFPPFNERRISYPKKVSNLRNITKIAAGSNHCLALDNSGSVFGWGSNSNVQLSHQQQFSQMNTPMIAAFTPVKISKNLDNSQVIDLKAGAEFSVLIAKNRVTQSYQVFTFGSNLKGQLAQGEIRHIRDVTKVDALSDFILKRKGKEQKVLVTSLGCGYNHTIVQLNIGYVMEWGDNQWGQMGNKRRSAVYTPIIVRQFSQKDILGVFAGVNSSGVIIRQDPEQKKE